VTNATCYKSARVRYKSHNGVT